MTTTPRKDDLAALVDGAMRVRTALDGDPLYSITTGRLMGFLRNYLDAIDNGESHFPGLWSEFTDDLKAYCMLRETRFRTEMEERHTP